MKVLKRIAVLILGCLICSCSSKENPQIDSTYVVKELEATYFDKKLVPNPDLLRFGKVILINSLEHLENFFSEINLPVTDTLLTINFDSCTLVFFPFVTEYPSVSCKHDFKVYYYNSTSEKTYYYRYTEIKKSETGENKTETLWYYTGVITKKIDDDSEITMVFLTE